VGFELTLHFETNEPACGPAADSPDPRLIRSVGDPLQIAEVLKRKLAFPWAADRHREFFSNPAETGEGRLEVFGRQVDDQAAHFIPDPAGRRLILTNSGGLSFAHEFSLFCGFLLGRSLTGWPLNWVASLNDSDQNRRDRQQQQDVNEAAERV
jgi:hypothetical protein